MNALTVLRRQQGISLHPGCTDPTLHRFARTLPAVLPPDIVELLTFASGFDVPGGASVDFTGLSNTFQFPELIPAPVAVGKTVTGDFWVVDVARDGRWGCVLYVSHDPPIFCRAFDGLADLIECAAHPTRLDDVEETLIRRIWNNGRGCRGIAVVDAKRSADAALRGFAETLTDDYAIFDWRGASDYPGFAWTLDAAPRYRRDGDRLIFAKPL